MFKVLISSIALSSTLFVANVHAQSPHGQQAPAQMAPQAQMPAPTENEVNQFVTSLVKVENLKQELQQDLAKKPQDEVTNDVLEKVNMQFQQQATKIIKDEGLSVEQYTQMIALLQQDPAFLQTIQERVEQAQ